MRPRSARIVTGLVLGTVILVALAGIVMGAVAADRIEPGRIVVVGSPDVADAPGVIADLERRVADGATLVPGISLVVVALLAVGVLWTATGMMIVTRQPRNASGWVFVAIGAVISIQFLTASAVVWGTKVDPGWPVPLAPIALLGEYVFYPVALLPLLFLLFPDGRAPSPRWRWAVGALVAGLAFTVIGFVFGPGPLNNYVEAGVVYINPIGINALSTVGPILTALGGVMILGVALATVVAVRQRFRRATGETRQQLRWLVLVASILGILLIFQFLITPVLAALFDAGQNGPPIFDYTFALIAATVGVGIPGAYLIAIFRHGLWDLDVVVKKAVVVALVAVGLTATGLLIGLVLPLAVVGMGSGFEVFPILVGLVLGLLFGPIRRWARRVADRVVYGRRATPYEVLTEFGENVRTTYSAEDVLPRMAEVLGRATGADVARAWVRVGETLRPAARWPADAPDTSAVPAGDDAGWSSLPDGIVPIESQGELLGALSVEMPANDPLDPARKRLIEDFAGQASLALRNVRLIEELRASRQRLVAAQDEERRRIERNLHDGVQQQLVALNVQLGLLAKVAEREPARAGEMAPGLQVRATEALEDLRDLARGIYPPLLADKGLSSALEAQARKAAVPTAVRSEGIGRYDQAVESAVYFCSLEALTNIAKYANASGATVHLVQTDGHLTFTVTDDGDGFDASATSYGTGLQGMADRLDAIGGTLVVTSAPGDGTTVRGSLPVV
jgi:signal transduction histidine kinase